MLQWAYHGLPLWWYHLSLSLSPSASKVVASIYFQMGDSLSPSHLQQARSIQKCRDISCFRYITQGQSLLKQTLSDVCLQQFLWSIGQDPVVQHQAAAIPPAPRSRGVHQQKGLFARNSLASSDGTQAVESTTSDFAGSFLGHIAKDICWIGSGAFPSGGCLGRNCLTGGVGKELRILHILCLLAVTGD